MSSSAGGLAAPTAGVGCVSPLKLAVPPAMAGYAPSLGLTTSPSPVVACHSACRVWLRVVPQWLAADASHTACQGRRREAEGTVIGGVGGTKMEQTFSRIIFYPKSRWKHEGGCFQFCTRGKATFALKQLVFLTLLVEFSLLKKEK
jgi:hypothetical protein